MIGFGYLRAMHLNDSKAAFGSRKDRHENIGKGEIGLDCFEWVMNDSRLQGLPLIMETPVQVGMWALWLLTSLATIRTRRNLHLFQPPRAE